MLSLSVLLGLCTAVASQASDSKASLDFLVGTWTGTSTCVGNRPACKNEVVVYRFLPVDGHAGQVRQLADKVIDGKRIPMGTLVFDVDLHNRTLRSEFEVRQTHGVWSFRVAADALTGTLVILPGEATAREVSAHRVDATEVPEAPPPGDYAE